MSGAHQAPGAVLALPRRAPSPPAHPTPTGRHRLNRPAQVGEIHRDPPAASDQPGGAPPTGRDWAGLLVISLAVSIVIVDITIVNVAIPQIIVDLGVSGTTAQWVQEAYTLCFAAFLLPFGRTADRFGRRRILLLGVLVFALASLLAATAAGGTWLVASRAVQGVGAAAIFPASLSLINAGFQGRYRATAFAVWGSTIGGMAALGPLIGGLLTTDLSWRWAFGVNLPICAVVIVGALAVVRESRDPAGTSGRDVIGVLLSVLAVGLLVLALIEGRSYGWWSPLEVLNIAGRSWPHSLLLSPVPFAVLLAALCAAALLAWERRRNALGRAALIDLSLFSITSFARGNIVAVVVALGEFGVLFTLPLWLQNVQGRSAAATGVLLLPMALAAFLAGGVAAAVATSRGPLIVVRCGLVLEIIGITGLAVVIAPDTTALLLAPFLAVYGFGVGLATAQLPGLVLRDVPLARSGQASGTETTAQQVGSALGIAVLGTVLFSVLAGGLTDRLHDAQLPPEVSQGIVDAVTTSAGAAIHRIGDQPGAGPVVAAAEGAFSDATRVAAATAAGFLLIGLAASASLSSAGTRRCSAGFAGTTGTSDFP